MVQFNPRCVVARKHQEAIWFVSNGVIPSGYNSTWLGAAITLRCLYRAALTPLCIQLFSRIGKLTVSTLLPQARTCSKGRSLMNTIIAQQLRRPSGLLGRLFMGTLLKSSECGGTFSRRSICLNSRPPTTSWMSDLVAGIAFG